MSCCLYTSRLLTEVVLTLVYELGMTHCAFAACLVACVSCDMCWCRKVLGTEE